MAAVLAAQTIAPPFSNAKEVVRVVYDFAKDAGATGALDLFTADGDIVITHAHATVKTTATSGGSATVIWGLTGDTNRFMDTTAGAVANLTAAAVISPASADLVPIKLASGDKVLMTIGTAALTAGKIEFVMEYMKP
jgi:hypothetical protein